VCEHRGVRTVSGVLRPLRVSDARDVLRAFESSPDMARQGEVTNIAQAEAYVENLVADGGHCAFAITEADVLVGMVVVTVDQRNRVGWFWYWMDASHRGRGWTASAAASIADWALSEGGLDRLELGHRVNNPASAAVAQAAGFVREGLEREKFLIDGHRIDVLTYGRLASDPQPQTPRMRLLPR